MTLEQFKKQQKEMNDEELIFEAREAIAQFAKTGRLTMSIPPRITDTDILLNELIDRFEDLTQ